MSQKIFEAIASRKLLDPRGHAYIVGKDLLGYDSPELALVGTVDTSACSATFIISTQGIDRDGDEVVSKGCDLADYRKNPIVLFGHQSGEPPIGLSKSPSGQLGIKIEDAKILGTCWFDQGDPDAMFLFGKVARGYLNAASVGFIPQDASPRNEGGWRFSKWRLTEWSIVPIPANADAVRACLGDKGCTPRIRKALETYSNPKTTVHLESKMSDTTEAAPEAAPEVATKADLAALQKKLDDMQAEASTAQAGIAESVGALAQSIAALMEAAKPAAPAAATGQPGQPNSPAQTEDATDPNNLNEDAADEAGATEEAEGTDPAEEEEEDQADALTQRYRKPPPGKSGKSSQVIIAKPGVKLISAKEVASNALTPTGAPLSALKACMKEASDYMDTAAGDSAMPDNHKGWMKYHALCLRKGMDSIGESPESADGSMAEPADGSADVKGIDVSLVKAELENTLAPLRERQQRLADRLYSATGQEI